ncbi:MAG: GTPase [Planctomycetota bacterium]
MPGGDHRVELLTARGAGGIAVVRLRGPERFVLAARLLGTWRPDAIPRRRWLTVDGVRLDEALVLARDDEASIELHVHGSPAVLRALGQALGGLSSARLPARAALLAACASVPQLDFALEQQSLLAPYGGDFARWVAAHAGDPQVLRRADDGLARLHDLMQPLRLVLRGRRNAGKSTLMNRLLLRERVLAGPTPGLTRDPVRDTTELDGYPYELVDTAGEGDALDALDEAAIERARAEVRHAAVAVVVDAAAGVQAVERTLLRRHPDAFVVRTKTDLRPAVWPPDLAPPHVDVSCLDVAGAAGVRADVAVGLRRWRRLPPAGPAGFVVAVDEEERAVLRAALDRADG